MRHAWDLFFWVLAMKILYPPGFVYTVQHGPDAIYWELHIKLNIFFVGDTIDYFQFLVYINLCLFRTESPLMHARKPY